MFQPKSILITKPLSEVPLLEAFCATHRIRLIAESFIEFTALKADIPSNMEVLFLGSRRAVDFFLLQADIPENCKIACIGSATAAHLEKRGYQVDFSGSKSGDPESVAEELKAWLGNRTLHVALSEQSKRSISKALPEKQTEEIIVYRTLSSPSFFTEPIDFIAFTSPSNLEGFLINNKISGEAKIIAWGKTTEKSLNALNYKADFVLENASEAELVSILESLI